MKVEDECFGNGDVETTLASARDGKRVCKLSVITNIFSGKVTFSVVIKSRVSGRYTYNTFLEAKNQFATSTPHM